jgi:cytochrome P450
MHNVLFLQSEVKDPYALYSKMLRDHPLYYDRSNYIWAVYSFDDCLSVLKNSTAYIPKNNKSFTTESIEVKTILQNLARLSNPPHHDPPRKASLDLMSRWRGVDTPALIHNLIGEPKKPAGIDWVNEVSKKLPVLALLRGFHFSSTEIELILAEVENLVKIMSPVRSEVQNDSVNRSVKMIWNSMNSCVSRICGLTNEPDVNLYSSNLIGLLVQSYDAGRGLLSNSLLQLLKEEQRNRNDLDYFERSVKETLRFDPPVHNTRRVLTESVMIQNQPLASGENVLIVMAAANRDSKRFSSPDTHSIFRNETPQYLSYGAGAHQCMAEHFSIQLAAAALHYIYSKYENIKLQESEIKYEPRVNVRLPVKMYLIVS